MRNLDEPRSNGEEPAPVSILASLSVIAILVVIGGLGWWLSLRTPLELDPKRIETFPVELSAWRGVDIPISESVERMLRADSQIQRNYTNEKGELVWLYIGYYGTERGGRPEHTPWVCYPSAGWEIESAKALRLDASDGLGDAKMNELVVGQAGHKRLVHFWYATHRSTGVASESALTLDHLVGRFSLSGRADGALVRLSTPIGESGIEEARQRLDDFAEDLVPVLRSVWPAVSKASGV